MADARDRTHYDVLGVKPTASASELRTAHRQLARVLHPDRLGDASDAERRLADRRMREVNAAWSELSDPTRRSAYDQRLKTSSRASGSPSGSSSSGSAAASARPSTAEPNDSDGDELAFEDLPPHLNLLRRGPLILVLLTAGLIFVVTAYAGSSARSDPSTSISSTTVAPANCVRIVDPDRRTGVRTPCGPEAVERLVTSVAQPLDCPERTRYVIVDHDVMCSTSDPSVASNNISGG